MKLEFECEGKKIVYSNETGSYRPYTKVDSFDLEDVRKIDHRLANRIENALSIKKQEYLDNEQLELKKTFEQHKKEVEDLLPSGFKVKFSMPILEKHQTYVEQTNEDLELIEVPVEYEKEVYSKDSLYKFHIYKGTEGIGFSSPSSAQINNERVWSGWSYNTNTNVPWVVEHRFKRQRYKNLETAITKACEKINESMKDELERIRQQTELKEKKQRIIDNAKLFGIETKDEYRNGQEHNIKVTNNISISASPIETNKNEIKLVGLQINFSGTYTYEEMLYIKDQIKQMQLNYSGDRK